MAPPPSPARRRGRHPPGRGNGPGIVTRPAEGAVVTRPTEGMPPPSSPARPGPRRRHPPGRGRAVVTRPAGGPAVVSFPAEGAAIVTRLAGAAPSLPARPRAPPSLPARPRARHRHPPGRGNGPAHRPPPSQGGRPGVPAPARDADLPRRTGRIPGGVFGHGPVLLRDQLICSQLICSQLICSQLICSQLIWPEARPPQPGLLRALLHRDGDRDGTKAGPAQRVQRGLRRPEDGLPWAVAPAVAVGTNGQQLPPGCVLQIILPSPCDLAGKMQQHYSGRVSQYILCISTASRK